MRDNMPPPKADYVDVVPQYDLYDADEKQDGERFWYWDTFSTKTALVQVVSTAIGCTCAIMFCSYVLGVF
jgi:hypothetical protein